MGGMLIIELICACLMGASLPSDSTLPFLQYGSREVGVVYPGEMEVNVGLSPDQTFCVTSDTSCTRNLPRNSYNITFTQTNGIDMTVDHYDFDSQWY